MIIYNRDDSDKTVIMGVRQWLAQRFIAPDWLDLRVGFLLSITASDTDDETAGLAETIPTHTPGTLGVWDRYYIGLIHKDTFGTFIGYTNRGHFDGTQTFGASKLISSDEGVGTSNMNFWWPRNDMPNRPMSANWSGQVIETFAGRQQTRVQSGPNVQQHFVQDPVGADAYATLLMLRFQRDNVEGRSNIIKTTLKQGTNSSDVLFTDDPSYTLLQTELESFPETVQTWGPVELQNVPDALFLYWPFHYSRLRIHAMGVEKIAT